MSLFYKIKALYPEIAAGEFELANYGDGRGEVIQEWYSKEYPKPTDEQLENAATVANELQVDTLIRNKRKNAYPSDGDQFDMIYRAIKSGDANFTEFVAAIDAVKAKFPKPAGLP